MTCYSKEVEEICSILKIIRLEEEISVVRELTKNVVAENGKGDAANRYEALAERYDRAFSEDKECFIWNSTKQRMAKSR